MRSDEKRVVLISANWEASFNASTFELREKALLKFDHSKVDGLEVSAGELRATCMIRLWLI